MGLYDSCGVLRYAGRDRADCLAYAALFELEEPAYCLEPLAIRISDGAAGADPAVAALV